MKRSQKSQAKARAAAAAAPTTTPGTAAPAAPAAKPAATEPATPAPNNPGPTTTVAGSGVAGTASPSRGREARESVSELLRRLEASTSPTLGTDDAELHQVADAATEHTEALRATRTAQAEAQELLALATKVRGEASEQAERIVGEAQEAADRLEQEARRHADRARHEATGWAAERRRTVEAVITELMESAERDADDIRTDALATAMTEAERTARTYVAATAAKGVQDAESIRDDARRILTRSAGLVEEAQVSMREVAATMASFVDALAEQATAVERLLDEARTTVTEHVGTTAGPTGEAALLADVEAVTETSRVAADEPETADADAADADAPADDNDTDDTDEPEGDESEGSDDAESDEASAADDSDDQKASADSRAGRPLGSLFHS